MGITFKKVAVTTMRSVISNAIRRAIMDGELQPGERIVERKLAAQFEASLTVIREALVQLETEGFIVKRRNTATYVTQVTLEDAAKMFELRAVLEPHTAGQAARLATPDDLQQLREIHTRASGRAADHDLRGYLREDYAWHDRMWQIAGNEYIRLSLARTIIPSFAFFAIRCTDPPFDLVQDAAEHLRILDAIAAHDGPRAEQLVRCSMAKWHLRAPLYAEPAMES